MLRTATQSLRALRTAAAPRPAALNSLPLLSHTLSPTRHYSAQPAQEATQEPAAAAQTPPQGEAADPSATKGNDQALADLNKQLEDHKKQIAEHKVRRLRTLADFENLQKISAREKQAAKDFALQSFAKDLISEIDVLNLALRSIPEDRITAADNADLKGLYEGVGLLKRGLEKVLGRHGIVPFDPTGEQFDPNRHEALYQAPVPGKEPGSVLECQEIGCASLRLSGPSHKIIH
ncbi:GrpE-domain-containing protein [Rhodotorula diobovata]|uniref:GrpE protein homolog, mitochondrial n=1 Tax=Rhodotorula diobovata TaxID=5288 RepID=A0A5C5G273_9BASI|nr:GrpE-domain-containing protein [Rhodotorula diobovata]